MERADCIFCEKEVVVEIVPSSNKGLIPDEAYCRECGTRIRLCAIKKSKETER